MKRLIAIAFGLASLAALGGGWRVVRTRPEDAACDPA